MKRQRGAALLLAMLTVTLVATLASAALWQQWRSVEVEQAERDRLQSGWILTGALDWARLILREDGRTNMNTGSGDNLSEPWAVGLQEARLSSFLAADKNTEPPPALDAFLSGDIQDQQARLNFANLEKQGVLSEPDLRMFVRLFEQLGLNRAELTLVARQWVAAARAQNTPAANANSTADTPSNSGTAKTTPMLPRRVAQLTWLGLSPDTLRRLTPFVTVLPERTPVNLNTAPLEVLMASVGGLDKARARRLMEQRALQPFKTLADATLQLGTTGEALTDSLQSTGSRYFEVRGRLRLGDRVLQEQSLIVRNGLDVRTLWRERTAATAQALAPDGQTVSLQ
jgi:general secretion pathway protein K